MAKHILYLVRGETMWMLSLRGIPEDEDWTVGGGAHSTNILPTTVCRDVDVETTLRLVQAQHPASEVRILNWHRPKRDV